jgi:hypothetical protein
MNARADQDAVMVPAPRLKTLGANDVVRHDSQAGNAFGVLLAPAPAHAARRRETPAAAEALARAAAITEQDLVSSRRGAIAAAKASKDSVPS